MFTIGNNYSFEEIKEKLGAKKGGSIIRKGKDFVALTMGGKNHIEPNLFLVGSGSLIRKVGRDLASEKKAIDIFYRGKYKGKALIDKTETAPKSLESKLSSHPQFNPKDFSRIVYLKFTVNEDDAPS